MTKTNRKIRDLAIVLALANGKSAKEIAAELGLTYASIRSHIERLKEETETLSTTHLAATYIRNNLIP